MKDILPEEMQIRDYVQQVIKETYRSFGFTPIETPCMENIANLSNKQGGENEKLIFKVMKRGEKLKVAEAKEEADLVDFGMRYDLTVPLVRFYSNNANDLPSPFKAIQMGNVWRADRPQRGRYRQFMQCDIDIIGEPTNLAEIELILATTTTIGKLGFKNFEIRINERRILKAMAAYSGFAEEDFDTVFIILDKMDKIGLDGVAEELEKEGYAKESIEKYLALFKGVEEAENGTIFLDEIGEMAFDLQAKLLRILETGEFLKIGDTKPVKVNVRVIAATNRDLAKEIADGHFREDLFYRLSVFHIHLPPLRERVDDIPLHVEAFVSALSSKIGKTIRTISPDYVRILKRYPWKGNVRELRNVVERSLIISDGDTLTADTLPLTIQNPQNNTDSSYSGFDLDGVEKMHIQKVLKYTNGNKTETSRLLGIGLTTLYRKIEEYGL